MATATRLTKGVYREVWQSSAPLSGGATETITTGIHANAVTLSRVFGVLALQTIAGAPSISATPSVVNGLLVVTLLNAAAPGNSSTWQLNVQLTHSIQQGLDALGVGCIYVIGSGAGGTGGALVVENIAELRTWEGGSTTQAATVKGYYAAADGGGGDFVWTTDTTAADNSGTVIVPTAVPRHGCWKRFCDQANIRFFGAVGNGIVDDTIAVSNAVADAVANQEIVYVPAGTYRLTSKSSFNTPVGFLGVNAATAILLIDIDNATDGLVWAALDPVNPARGGSLKQLTIKTTNANTVRDLVSLVNWDGFVIDDCVINKPSRYSVSIYTSMNITIQSTDLSCQGFGVSSLYVSDGSTAVRCTGCYFGYTAEGPGADITETDFYSCVFESNGSNYAHNAHGAQDPKNGAGLRVRHDHCRVIGGHFENNAGHAMYLGSDGGTASKASVSVIGANIGGDVLNYTQPTAAAIYADHVASGIFTGMDPYMPRSIVFTVNSSRVAVFGVNVSHSRAPEYLALDWHGNPTDISYYPGLIQYTDPSSGINLLTGGNAGGVQALMLGSVYIAEANPAGGSTLHGKIYFDQAIDNPGAGTVKYLWNNGTVYELVGGSLSVDSKILLPTDTNSTPGNTATINKPSGVFTVAGGVTSFKLNNSVVTSISQVFVNLRSADATAQVKSVVADAGFFIVNLVAPALDVPVGFVVFN